MVSLNMFVFICISFLAICGIIGAIQKDRVSEIFLIMSNILFILYGSYMAYIEKRHGHI